MGPTGIQGVTGVYGSTGPTGVYSGPAFYFGTSNALSNDPVTVVLPAPYSTITSYVAMATYTGPLSQTSPISIIKLSRSTISVDGDRYSTFDWITMGY
jgi:hypothetical protein